MSKSEARQLASCLRKLNGASIRLLLDETVTCRVAQILLWDCHSHLCALCLPGKAICPVYRCSDSYGVGNDVSSSSSNKLRKGERVGTSSSCVDMLSTATLVDRTFSMIGSSMVLTPQHYIAFWACSLVWSHFAMALTRISWNNIRPVSRLFRHSLKDTPRTTNNDESKLPERIPFPALTPVADKSIISDLDGNFRCTACLMKLIPYMRHTTMQSYSNRCNQQEWNSNFFFRLKQLHTYWHPRIHLAIRSAKIWACGEGN